MAAQLYMYLYQSVCVYVRVSLCACRCICICISLAVVSFIKMLISCCLARRPPRALHVSSIVCTVMKNTQHTHSHTHCTLSHSKTNTLKVIQAGDKIIKSAQIRAFCALSSSCICASVGVCIYICHMHTHTHTHMYCSLCVCILL